MKSPPSSSLHENTPYWQYFTPAEQAALRNTPPHDLTGVMRLVGGGLLQLFEDEQRNPSHEHQETAENLQVYGRAAVAIGMMERTRLKVQGLSSRWDSVIQAAYKLARQQMGVDTYLLESNLAPKDQTE